MPAVPKPKTTLRYKYNPNKPPTAFYETSQSSNNAASFNADVEPPHENLWKPEMPYDEPASYPKYPSSRRVPARDDGQWEVRITAFELFVMMLAMLVLIIILAWLAVLLVDYLLPRFASKRRVVRTARKLSRQLSGWRWDGDNERHDHVLPLRSGRENRTSERYSDRFGVAERLEAEEREIVLPGTHGVLARGRSRANSQIGSRRGSVPNVGTGGINDIEKGQGEWVENADQMEARRRSGAV